MTDFGVWQQAPAFGFQLCIIKEEVMAKNTIWFVVIMVVGALLGSFLGKFIGIVVPAGSIRDLFSTEISAGLAPTTLDLRIVDFTFGCLFKLNVSAVLGILFAAFLFRRIEK
jgi:phosphate/sulfate permease